MTTSTFVRVWLKYLEEAGFQAVTASNGRDALRLLLEEELHPDLILLDLMMPVMDGWAFRAEQAKNRRLDSIPVVLFSAYWYNRRWLTG